ASSGGLRLVSGRLRHRRRMTFRSPRLALGAAALAATMLVAAGGRGSGSDAQVASLGGAGAATTTTAPGGSGRGNSGASDAARQQAMLDFASCMREHGVDMPDPKFDSEGHAAIAIGGGP